MGRLVTIFVVLLAAAVGLPAAWASPGPEDPIEVQNIITPPQITGVEAQALRYQDSGGFLDLPAKPFIVDVTLSLSGIAASGAYVTCSLTESPKPENAYLTLSRGPFIVQSLMPSTKYWCFATSSPVRTLDPAAWSAPFEVTTREALGLTTLTMSPAVFDIFASDRAFGPFCTWCRDAASNTWRWPMSTAWRKGRDTLLPGGMGLPLPGLFFGGLEARIGTARDGTPTIAALTTLGWVDIVTTKDFQVTDTGFTAKAFLTTNQLLLSYLPSLKLSPGQELGTLNVTQEFAASAPSAPISLVAKSKRNPKGGASVTVSWQPPLNDGGSPVTGYRYQTRVGKTTSAWTTTSALSFKMAVKSGTTVRVSVVAVNEVGQSPVASITSRA